MPTVTEKSAVEFPTPQELIGTFKTFGPFGPNVADTNQHHPKGVFKVKPW